VLLRLPVLVGAVALLAASAAAADEMQAPRVTLSQVNWAEAALSLPADITGRPEQEFLKINAQTEKRFPGIARSSVPVLLPIDLAAFRADVAAGKGDASNSDKYFGPFRPSKFFLPGPAGYMATFYLNNGAGGLNVSYKKKPVEISVTGAAFVVELDGPEHQEVFPVKEKELEDLYPGIKRVLHEAHVRYVFVRFGVRYVVAIQCYDRPVSSRYLSCREADPVAVKFLRMLATVGGTPQSIAEPQLDLGRPPAKSDFTYYSPGYLIPNSGYRDKFPGRADYHVYARMRFPIANPPGYVISQSFMPWGDCYRTGYSGRRGKKGAQYSCKRNGIPLVFDESAAVNFSYPWRDNFCEQRDFLVGECPGGRGHQGQDIRPGGCTLFNAEADRCLPYKHSVAAVRDGLIWRTAGNLAAYIVINTRNGFVRFRYLHLNPDFMDRDGLLSGREVSEGEIIGKVATWGDFENGTSYHLHFNMQVFTKVGWAWVNPYMSLVLAYERQIGGRGTEIKPDDPVPPIAGTAPVTLENAARSASADGVQLPPEKPERTLSPPEPKPEILAPEKPRKPARKKSSRKRKHR